MPHTHESVVDQCPWRDTLLVLGDFNASIGTDKNGYEICVGLHGSRAVNQNNTKFLDLTLEEVMDFGWLVHGFSTHSLITGFGIPMLVVWQRRLTMSLLMVAGG